MSNETNNQEKMRDVFNRSTLEVARSIIDAEKISTRNKAYLKEEARLCFLSVWTAFNTAFSSIVDLYESETTADEVKTKLEPIYKGIPVGFNLPLENRVPADVRKTKLNEADKTREETKAPSKIIVKGYNDPESLEEWAKHKQGE